MKDWLFAYIGPEIIMPFLSILAAVAGGILVGWRWVVQFLARFFRMGRESSEPAVCADLVHPLARDLPGTSASTFFSPRTSHVQSGGTSLTLVDDAVPMALAVRPSIGRGISRTKETKGESTTAFERHVERGSLLGCGHRTGGDRHAQISTHHHASAP